jgi:predicted Zn-dependent peptidase
MGDWRFVFEEPKRIQAVTATEVVEVAKRYLVPQHRTATWLVRGTAATARPAAGPFGRPVDQPWDPY